MAEDNGRKQGDRKEGYGPRGGRGDKGPRKDFRNSDRAGRDGRGGRDGRPRRGNDDRPFRKEGRFDDMKGKPFVKGERSEGADRKSYAKGGRPDGAQRKPYAKGDRFDDGKRKPFARDDRRSFEKGERREFDGDSRKRFDGDARKPYSKDDKKPFKKDDERSFRKDGEKPFRKTRDNDREFKKFNNGDNASERRERNGYAGRPERAESRKPQKPRKPVRATAGRVAAVNALRLVREREAFAQDVIGKHIDASSMSAEDRAFATRLVLGVVSCRGTIDEVLDRVMDSPDDIQDNVRDALQVSVYEIIFLDKDAYAAVDQGVELVRNVEPKAAGLANAVLRKVVNVKKEFPFGDPRSDLAAFARLHAFPQWLAEVLVRDLGAQGARDFMAASNEPAPLFVSLNAARADGEEVVSVLASAKGNPEPVIFNGDAVPGCYRISTGRVLLDGRVRHMLQTGVLVVSDASSQTVAAMVLPDQKPASFLEIGAGRGTKTILVQSASVRKYGSQIDGYVTVDNLEFKTKLLAERAEQCGIHVENAVTGDATKLDACLGDRQFDAVFIDAPCSGVGTLRRHPEIRWRIKPESSKGFAEVGLRMLASAAGHVAPGGTLSYATCTVFNEENINVVKRFLASDAGADFQLASNALFAPRLVTGAPDAHFCVKLVKNA